MGSAEKSRREENKEYGGLFGPRWQLYDGKGGGGWVTTSATVAVGRRGEENKTSSCFEFWVYGNWVF